MRLKESLLYIVFGVFTVLINMASFFLFYDILGYNELVANVYSWIFAVAFAFFTNKVYVFESLSRSINEAVLQFIMFISSRLATLFIEEVVLFIFITMLNYSVIIIKVFAQLLVIVLNYILSKKIVFKREDS